MVYQADVGTPVPAFFIFMPLQELKQNGDLLAWYQSLNEAEGEEAAGNLSRIARESYASTETNIYAVHPELSHESMEFAATDPDFWTHPVVREPKPIARPMLKAPIKH